VYYRLDSLISMFDTTFGEISTGRDDLKTPKCDAVPDGSILLLHPGLQPWRQYQQSVGLGKTGCGTLSSAQAGTALMPRCETPR